MQSRCISLAVLFLSLIAVSGSWQHSANAESARDGSVAAEFIAETESIQPGQPFTLALQLKIDPSWHTYWINPGDAGFPTKIEWQLPPGFSTGPVQFAAPHRFIIDFGGFKQAGLGYETETVHLIEITPPADLPPGTPVTLTGKVSWLMCDDKTCIPGNVEIGLTLPVTAEAPSPGPETELFSKARDAMPVEASMWTVALAETGDNDFTFTLTPPEGAALPAIDTLALYPETPNLVDLKPDQTFTESNGSLTLTLPKAEYFDSLPDALAVVLSSDDGFADFENRHALRVTDAAPTEPGATVADKGTSTDQSPASSSSASGISAVAEEPVGILGALFGALLGGLVLNLMPCVFPVISLKIMGFVSQAGESRKKLIVHGFVFAAGVLISFWILSGILLALRSAGESAGWGFQLQNPYFVISLILMMILVALNLFGVFEVGMGMTSAGGDLTMAGGFAGSFWSGALATLLATPCTAPFMGVALGFALDQPAIIALLIFTTLAVGMALPYVVLSIFPGWLKRLPRPGAWMETFKQVMGFPMLAVAAWLLWVAGAQLGIDGLGLIFVGLILIAIAAWTWGRFTTPERSPRGRRIAMVVAAIIAVFGGWASFQAAEKRPTSVATSAEGPAEIIQKHREAGKNVFVDFTAKWCLVCQANKPAMYSDAVTEGFAADNVEFVVIDNTSMDPRIEEFINGYGRTGVPLYPLFPADLSKGPVILPQNLTPGIILDHLQKLDDVDANFPSAK